MKDDPKKKKKKLPFYGRAYGGAARRRADRKAYKRGGVVSKADADLISPNEPHAPAGGKVEQKFKKGGIAKRQAGGATAKRLEEPDDDSRARPVGDVIGGAERFKPGPQAGAPTVEERFQGRRMDLPLIIPDATRRDKRAPLYEGYTPGPRGLKPGGVVKKRQGGGPADSDTTGTKVPKSSSVADLTTAGLNPLLPALGSGDLGLGGSTSLSAPPTPPAGMPGGPPGPVPATLPPPPVDTSGGGGIAGGGMRRGGAVRKRQEGGDIPPNKPVAWGGKLSPLKHTGSDERGPEPYPEENTAQKIARGINTVQRTLGRPMTRGAFDVQKYSDMDRAQRVSDAVPRSSDETMGRYKDGGRLSAAQRQSLPKSDFALPGRGSGPKGAGSGSYPIPDRGHAKAALSRGAANASPGEQATIKRKVKAKYPDMDVS